MLDPKRVCVESNEESLHKMFEKLGIKCIKVRIIFMQFITNYFKVTILIRNMDIRILHSLVNTKF